MTRPIDISALNIYYQVLARLMMVSIHDLHLPDIVNQTSALAFFAGDTAARTVENMTGLAADPDGWFIAAVKKEREPGLIR